MVRSQYKLLATRLPELTRKRKIHCNTPPQGRQRSCGRGAAEPKSVTPAQRAKEFPDKDIAVSNGKLFGRACREELSTKWSVFSHPQQLQISFGDRDGLALQDYIETALMLQYNMR